MTTSSKILQFVLQPPVPLSSSPLSDFERTLRGFASQSTLLALASSRQQLTVATRALVLSNNRRRYDDNDNDSRKNVVSAAVDAARTYHTKWNAFLANTLAVHGDSSRLRTQSSDPMSFPWHIPLLSHEEGSVLFADASVLFESACASLALAASLQAVGSDEALREGASLLRTTANESILVHFRPRIATSVRRVREPHIFSAAVFEAYAHGLEGQRAVAAVTTEEHSKCILALFSASAHYRRALDLLPADSALSTERAQVTARARYHLAHALAEGPGEFGVAIACLEEALNGLARSRQRRGINDKNVDADADVLMHTVASTLKKLQRLNETAAFQPIPSRNALTMRIDRTGAIRSLTVEHPDEDDPTIVCVVIPNAIAAQ